MPIDVIETFEGFDRIEANWNAVYDADPDAQLFLSWNWLSGWLRKIPSPWLILAAREGGKGGPYIAFLPLWLGVKETKVQLRNEVNMAGNFAADYTGILCSPGFEDRAIPAFARYLKRMNWGRLNLENIRISEPRHHLLLAHFPKTKFQIEEISRVSTVDGIDHALCPYAPLAADWEAYLAGLSANTRQKIRRLLKLIDASGEYRVTEATAETIGRDLDTLLRFWEIKWRPRKGDLVNSLMHSTRLMLTTSFEAGLLFLPTLWHEDRPVAALATLVDRRKSAFLFYMTGRDESFEGPSPGLTLHGYSIRHAIANSIVEYDFLRGNEPYKYSFGVKERHVKCVAISTRNGLNLGGRLDRRTLADALDKATELHKAGKFVEAERSYHQILEIDARNAGAIHRLGQLLTTRERHSEARQQFALLARLKSEDYKSWLCLATSCDALGEHLEAARNYRQVIRLRPDLPDGFAGLGGALHKLKRIEAFDTVLEAVIGMPLVATGKSGSRRQPEASDSPDAMVLM